MPPEVRGPILNAVRQSPCARSAIRDASMAALNLSGGGHSAAQRGLLLGFGLSLGLALIPADARAQTIETEHLFGFTIGSDVGDVGDREIEGSVTGRFAKRTGSYDATASTLSAEFVPVPNLRTEYTATALTYDIAGVSGFADQRYAAFGGLSLSLIHIS